MKRVNKKTIIVSMGLFLFGFLFTFVLAEEAPMTQTGETTKPGAIPEKLRNIQRVLIVGNSLTKHGPSTKKLCWPYNWGMAATAQEKDYAHQLYAKLRRVQQPKDRKPELKIESMLAYAIRRRKKLLDYKPDFVVLQMGDNLRKSNTNRKDFVEPYIKLVKAFQKADPHAVVVIVGLWGKNAKRNDLVEQVAKETHSIYVDLKPVSKNPKNSAGSEGNFTHDGVNWHPGNRGMGKIAEQIWTTVIQASATFAKPPGTEEQQGNANHANRQAGKDE